MRFFTKVKEIRSKLGKLHFQRFAIFETDICAFYIHRIYRHDEDLHLHSHPWNFVSMILWGEYYEKVPSGNYNRKSPGTISHMTREGFHKIAYITKCPVTTLFFTYGKRQPWYYLVDGEKIESEKYRTMKNAGEFKK